MHPNEVVLVERVNGKIQPTREGERLWRWAMLIGTDAEVVVNAYNDTSIEVIPIRIPTDARMN